MFLKMLKAPLCLRIASERASTAVDCKKNKLKNIVNTLNKWAKHRTGQGSQNALEGRQRNYVFGFC